MIENVQALSDKLARSRCDQDPSAVRRAMFELSKSRHPYAVEPLLGVLEDAAEDAEIRGLAAKSLGHLGNPVALDRLLVLAQTERTNVMFSVIEAIGRLRDTRALPVLISLMEEADHRVRFAVVGALEWLDSIESRDALKRASKDPRWVVRLRARRAYRRLTH